MDLKPDHVRIRPDSRSTEICIIDFGFSEEFTQEHYYAPVGTEGWIAPEHEVGEGCGHTPDIFSCGRILEDWAGAVGKVGNSWFDDFQNFVDWLLSDNAELRPTASEALVALVQLASKMLE